MKTRKFRTKNALFSQFRLKFEKIFVIFEISTLESVQIQKFVKKKKVFLGLIWKTIVIFDISNLEFVARQSFMKKMEQKKKNTILKFGTKNAFLGNF